MEIYGETGLRQVSTVSFSTHLQSRRKCGIIRLEWLFKYKGQCKLY